MRVSTGIPVVEQDCQALHLSGRQISILPTLVHPAGQGPEPSLLGAEVGNGLSCFPQGLQQSVHAVLRVNADLLVGQVNVKLNSSQLVEDPSDCVRAALTGHVHGELVLRHD